MNAVLRFALGVLAFLPPFCGCAQSNDTIRYFNYEGRYEHWLVQLEQDRALIFNTGMGDRDNGSGYALYGVDTLRPNGEGVFAGNRTTLYCDGKGCYIDRPGLGRDAHRKLLPIQDKSAVDFEINSGLVNRSDFAYHDSLAREYRYRKYYTPPFWRGGLAWATKKRRLMPHDEFRLKLGARLNHVLDSARVLLDSFGTVADRTIESLSSMRFDEFAAAFQKLPPDDVHFNYRDAILWEAMVKRPEFVLQFAGQFTEERAGIKQTLSYHADRRKMLFAVPGYGSVKRALGIVPGQ